MASALMAWPAARRSSQSGSSATTAARLARIVLVAFARFRRSWVLASALRAAAGNGSAPRRWPTPRGATGMPRNAGAGRSPRLPGTGVVPGGGQDLGQVDRLRPGAQAREATADVHEAGAVTRHDGLGPGGKHVAHLVGQHRG